jgi:hypothetical protein
MMNRPFTPTFQTGVIRHVAKAASPFFAQRRHSTTTIATVHDGCVIARGGAHHFIHDRSIIGSTFAIARFACLNRFEFTSIRRFASGEGAGTGKAPAGTAFEMQEAARKHREIQQSLLRQDPPSASAQPSPTSISSMAGKESNLAFLHELREQQREQKRRQAIISSVLSFLMVVLAAQGAKSAGMRKREGIRRNRNFCKSVAICEMLLSQTRAWNDWLANAYWPSTTRTPETTVELRGEVRRLPYGRIDQRTRVTKRECIEW